MLSKFVPIMQLSETYSLITCVLHGTDGTTFKFWLSHSKALQRFCSKYFTTKLLPNNYMHMSSICNKNFIFHKSMQRYSEPICGFRTQYAHNNFMVVMASELVGYLTNQSFVDYVILHTFLSCSG